MRPLVSHALVAIFSITLTLAASWHIQPHALKAQQDRAKWDLLLWLAKLSPDQREPLFKRALEIDEEARAEVTPPTATQPGEEK